MKANIKEQLVTIKIPRTQKEQEPVVVYLNDRRFVIKRGVPVDVPVGVAEILQNKEEMLEQYFEFVEANAKKD